MIWMQLLLTRMLHIKHSLKSSIRPQTEVSMNFACFFCVSVCVTYKHSEDISVWSSIRSKASYGPYCEPYGHPQSQNRTGQPRLHVSGCRSCNLRVTCSNPSWSRNIRSKSKRCPDLDTRAASGAR